MLFNDKTIVSVQLRLLFAHHQNEHGFIRAFFYFVVRSLRLELVRNRQIA